jgi:V8-like Glu-specific endopeptidase
MQTKSGQSGSPILVYEHGEWKVVGIHTLSQDAHYDPSGIYLNTEICEGINSWLKVVKGELCI